jgi:hypothetical protein
VRGSSGAADVPICPDVRRILLAAAVALLCLTGSADARRSADQGLAVSVDGPGIIAAAGIQCRDDGGDCVELYPDGATVTLTARAGSGATFAGWGGDCSAATGTTCTLTMNSAKAVTAAFSSGGGSDNPMLTVIVSGTGKVTGNGIDCGNGATDCSESYAPATAVTLNVAPGAVTSFSGWGGDCGGSSTTCSVVMSAARQVTASFGQASTKEPAAPATGYTPFTKSPPTSAATFAAHSLGRPLVARTSGGWAVTLRFFTSRAGTGLVRLSLNGRLLGRFTFSPPRGGVRVGPFKLARPGTYRFQLTLSDRRGALAQLAWSLAL